MFEDAAYPAAEASYGFPGGERALRTQDARGVLWYAASKGERQRPVLVSDALCWGRIFTGRGAAEQAPPPQNYRTPC